MAGTLVIDTLKASSGVLATQNGMTGIAKAWVNFDGTVSTPTIRGSFNVSSVVKNGTGDYTISFTTAMPDANYSLLGTCASGNAYNANANGFVVTIYMNYTVPYQYNTSGARITTGLSNSSAYDNGSSYVCVGFFR